MYTYKQMLEIATGNDVFIHYIAIHDVKKDFTQLFNLWASFDLEYIQQEKKILYHSNNLSQAKLLTIVKLLKHYKILWKKFKIVTSSKKVIELWQLHDEANKLQQKELKKIFKPTKFRKQVISNFLTDNVYITKIDEINNLIQYDNWDIKDWDWI